MRTLDYIITLTNTTLIKKIQFVSLIEQILQQPKNIP